MNGKAAMRALFAAVSTPEDCDAVRTDLDAMLILSETWFAMTAASFHHANRLLLVDADAPQARGWVAFVRELSEEAESERLLEDAFGGDYDDE